MTLPDTVRPLKQTITIPHPDEDKELVEQGITDAECQMEQYKIEQERRLKRALRRIRICAFLRRDFGTHYSWCPYEEWIDEWHLQFRVAKLGEAH